MQCECGCGQETPLADRTRRGHRKGEPLRFVHGHNRRKYHGPVDHAVCATCKRDLPAEKFYQDKSRPTGLTSRCKICASRAAMSNYSDDRDHRLIVMADYRARPENRARQAEQAQQWADEHRDRVRAAYRRWAQIDPVRARRIKRDASETRRTRLLGAFVEVVDSRVVYERDQGICGICNLPVPWDDLHIDHVIPLSKGGKHSYANVQSAHSLCNFKKGARIL